MIDHATTRAHARAIQPRPLHLPYDSAIPTALKGPAMTPCITSPQVATLLDTLHADAARTDPLVRHQAMASGASPHVDERAFFTAMRGAYLPVSPAFGRLLYALARSARAEMIVEFGTSFGISTIYLAAAIRDNGHGKVVTTEYDAGKAHRARANLAAAGLERWVEIRVGDALDTLAEDPPRKIDLVLLDGAKSMYLDVLTLIEPDLLRGAIIASDNTDHDGMADFLAHVRDPAKGYVSSPILTGGRGHGSGKGHEISIRI